MLEESLEEARGAAEKAQTEQAAVEVEVILFAILLAKPSGPP